ncbi:hypothetical protein NF552_22575 (plasmid) [Roseomonas mucosa]|nr:hypothetical protein NF552_22575 [Roseomonas mucosa]
MTRSFANVLLLYTFAALAIVGALDALHWLPVNGDEASLMNLLMRCSLLAGAGWASAAAVDFLSARIPPPHLR